MAQDIFPTHYDAAIDTITRLHHQLRETSDLAQYVTVHNGEVRISQDPRISTEFHSRFSNSNGSREEQILVSYAQELYREIF